ncbi:class Ib ribonucleoside-diphosphate reductase assembly flavoprotein NrdI [Salinicoccus albus]|uniref:class Ib ribonucleoside-diphosphate reductase assembly flavoprotein NrdI n=1 Tax=Salinicoccus albus TaxID=418756 RepID=UPI000380081C|nr:class Ib ribonucleoside-diphosphate reductase assembly flavoprotein NrdI [Salinicoccus albus]
MRIAFYSMTGNVRRFIDNAGVRDEYDVFEITPGSKETVLDDPFVLVTPTYGFGGVPAQVEAFLEVNSSNLKGVASSGNRNWGAHYAQAGQEISGTYNVPLMMKFELHGTPAEREEFIEKAGAINESIEREEIQPH